MGIKLDAGCVGIASKFVGVRQATILNREFDSLNENTSMEPREYVNMNDLKLTGMTVQKWDP